MIITLFTETDIDGAHYLWGYSGKCSRMHGHTWLLQLWIQGDEQQQQQDEVGILFDFGKIKEIKEMFDHKILNEVCPFKPEQISEDRRLLGNPTAENIALFILRYLEQGNRELAFRVRIYETAVLKKTYCQVQSHRFDPNYL